MSANRFSSSPRERFDSLVVDIRSTHFFSATLKEELVELMVRSYELGIAAGKLEALEAIAKEVAPT